MTEQEKLEFLDRMIRNGANIGQFIMDNHGTMEITNHMGESSNNQKRETNGEQIAKALAKVQDLMWGQSANAIIFCALRDNHGYPDNMSQFEREWKGFSAGRHLSWDCPEGTLRAAFRDNSYLKLPVDKWRDNGVPDRVIKLLDRFEEQMT